MTLLSVTGPFIGNTLLQVKDYWLGKPMLRTLKDT